jgi:hypothetical protein
MKTRMASISLLIIITSLVALLLVGIEGSGHKVFANRATSGHEAFTNRGIDVQTDTNQDQGCEGVGGTSGITNACTATSGRGSTETSIALTFANCNVNGPTSFSCNIPLPPASCNNLGCLQINCVGSITGVSNCTTDTGVQLTSCTVNGAAFPLVARFTCTLAVPSTGTSSSGGVTGDS